VKMFQDIVPHQTVRSRKFSFSFFFEKRCAFSAFLSHSSLSELRKHGKKGDMKG